MKYTKYEKCGICKKRISKNETGKWYCMGHSLSEIAKKLQQYKQVSIFSKTTIGTRQIEYNVV